MGRLAGFKYREVVRRLKRAGFQLFNRQAAGSHEIWFSPTTNRYTTIPNHPADMPEGTLRAILAQAGVAPDEFLNT
jgi:predicted RNA binding protein YcfA (HicA-like mRNA interferase family)